MSGASYAVKVEAGGASHYFLAKFNDRSGPVDPTSFTECLKQSLTIAALALVEDSRVHTVPVFDADQLSPVAELVRSSATTKT